MNENQNGMPNPYNPNNGGYPNNGTYPSGGVYSNDSNYQNAGTYQNGSGYQNGNRYQNTEYQGAGGYQNGGYQNVSAGQNMEYGTNYGYSNTGWPAGQATYSNDPIILAPSAPEQGGKKKVGLVVGAIAAVLLLIGDLVAVSMLSSSSEPKDPISVAVSRLLSDDAPDGVAIDGKASLSTSVQNSFLRSAELRLKSELMVDSLINSTVVSLNASLATGGDISLKLSENYSGEDDIFVKLDGIGVTLKNQNDTAKTTQASKNSKNQNSRDSSEEEIEVSDEYLKCLSDINSGDDCKDLMNGGASADDLAGLAAFTNVLNTLSSVDGEWIRIPTSSINASTLGGLAGEDVSQCTVNLVSDLHGNRSSVGDAYNGNPFVYSKLVSQEDNNLSDLDKKVVTALLSGDDMANEEDEDTDNEEAEGEEAGSTPIYQVMYDEQTLKNFARAAIESGALSGLNSCLGQDNTDATVEKVAELAKNLPSVFVTLDNSLNFTKIYFGFAMDSKSNVVAGLNLSYPENITVTKPGSSKNFSEVIQGMPSRN